MILDTRTLVIIAVITTAALSLVMIYTWRTRKTYPGFELWTIGDAMLSLGFLLISFRDLAPDWISIVVANIALISSGIFYYEGIRRFRDRRASPIFDIAFIILYLPPFIYFTFILPSLAGRIVVFSISLAILLGLCAAEIIYQAPQKYQRTYRMTGVWFAAGSLALLVRVAMSYQLTNEQGFFALDLGQTIFYVAAQVLTVGWTFSFITLNSERLEHDLQVAQAELKRLAITDYLTGLYNSRHFFEICKQEIQRARRYGHPLAVILLDIDHFKQVNDSYGHAAGDKVLVNIAAICRDNLRQVDLLSRLGGEEFVVLMPETDQVNATAAAERIRAAIAGAIFRVGEAELHITASLGVAMLTAQDKDIEPVLNRADAAMYDAKRGGRDKVSS